MIFEIFKNISKTENCRILDIDTIQNNDSIKNFKNVIEVNTEISLQRGVKEVVLFIGICEPPVSLPKIFIKRESYEDIQFIPHVDKDLSICIYDEGMNHVFNESSLPDIVEEMIYRAKKIISQVDELETISAEFEREFKAYWEISYDKNDVVNEIGLSIIKDASLPYKGYHFKKPLNGFRYLLYQEFELFEKFKKYLDYRNVQYTDIEVFDIVYLKKRPPFHLSFGESIKYINELDLKRFRKTINGHGMHSALVVFKNHVEECFGWVYSSTIPPLSIMKGWHANLSSWQIMTSSTFNKSLVERLAFSRLTPQRLENRTSGFYKENKISICVIGLGSVGSNLLNFLIKLPINKFHLIDSDILKLENIYRHQYGFDKIGIAKVEAAKANILNKDPFCEVLTNTASILDILNNECTILKEYDLNMVVVGNTMIEKYILEHLIKTECEKPLIIIWVEPFLASGQMLYICPDDFSKAKDTILNFPFVVLKDDKESQVYLKEGSCQTGYFPYSESNLTLFLSAIFPNLFELTQKKGSKSSKVFTWIGDKEFIEERGLKLSDFGISKNSFATLVNDL